MIVVMAYDIDTTEKEGYKRLRKILKVSRRYLFQVQKSVFKGEISIGKLNQFKKEIYKIIDPSKDKVVIYTVDNYGTLSGFEEEQLGKFSEISNII